MYVSLTGAVSSEKVTEEYKGNFDKFFNILSLSIMAKSCLTVKIYKLNRNESWS